MSNKLMSNLISCMNRKLNHIIEKHNFDLSHIEVLKYSMRLDKVILHYLRRRSRD